MIIDCDTCSGQGRHCHDCVITVLLNAPPADFQPGVQPGLQLDSDEQIALVRLADAGLVPPLRLVPGGDNIDSDIHSDIHSDIDTGQRPGDTRGIA